MKSKILSAFIAACLFAAPVSAHADKIGTWAGLDLAPSSYYVYLGAVGGLNGQDITSQDGFLLRGSAGYGQYDYDTTGLGNIDGDVTSGDLMVGYGHFFQQGFAKAYIGGDLNHHHLDPKDPNSKVEGSQGGLKGLLELGVNVAPKIDLGAMGSYSTSYDTYWTKFNASYNFGAFKVGPEALFMGDKSYDQRRIGASISDIDVGFAKTRLYAGYSNTSGRGDDGAYGGVAFGVGF